MISLADSYSSGHVNDITGLINMYVQNYYKDCSKMETPVRKPNLDAKELFEEIKIWEKSSDKSLIKLDKFLKIIFDTSMKLHHPRYIGHQVSAPLPLASLFDYISSILNNGAAVFDMGPVEPLIEKRLCELTATKASFDSEKSGGFFTSGGSLGNFTALLAAKNIKLANSSITNSAVLISSQAHYSLKRSLKILGFNESQIFSMPSDENFKVDVNKLQQILDEIKSKGLKPFLLAANACSTATGTFDPLDYLGDFCNKNNIWFHVDGAHGGSALFSDKAKDLLKGLNKADSFIIDYHKMMLMPALITGVIFKRYEDSYCTFGEKASYLYNSAEEDSFWLDLGHRTLECTKSLMAVKLYACLNVYGESLFANYLDNCIELTRYAYDKMSKSGKFLLPHNPEYNILCYKVKDKDDSWHQEVCRTLIKKGLFYIVSTKIDNDLYFRSTFINPFTSKNDIDALLDAITMYSKT